LLDYRLQDGTGLEVAQKVRRLGSSAPITLITGYNSDVIAAEARGLDIFQIIGKPFTREAICSTIQVAFERVSEARGDTTYQGPARVPSDKGATQGKLR
jgi:FixJ family two-component response regulator